MPQLAPLFRRRFVALGQTAGFSQGESNMRRLLAHRQSADLATQEVWVSPQSIFVSDGEPLGLSVGIWTYVVFPTLEDVVNEALRTAGADLDLTDRRTVRFPLSSIVRNEDPSCVQGLPLDPNAFPELQAEFAWHFYWERAAPHLARLQSVDVLADLSYIPPFTSTVAWSTRQLLYHAKLGKFELCQSIAKGIERTAATDLLSSPKGLMSVAAGRGHEFRPNPDALDYKRHPLWIEFEAVRAYAGRLA